METRKSRCQSLLQKSDSSLRQELCSYPYRRNGTKSRDVLLIPQEWYPDYKPKYETPGWWYVPTEENATPSVNSWNLQARNGTARIKPAAAGASLNMIEPAGRVEARRLKFPRVKEK